MRSAELVGVAQPVAYCGEIGGIGRRCEVAERRVGALLVVIVGPIRDLFPRMIEAEKQALVEKLVAHAGVEARAETVLHRLAGRDEMPDDSVVLRPAEYGVRGELGSIVGDDHAGLAAPLDQRRQLARHAPAGDRGVGDRRQAFPRYVVDNVEDPEPSAQANWSWTKSRDQRALATASTRIGARVPTARRRARRLRTVRPSSR